MLIEYRTVSSLLDEKEKLESMSFAQKTLCVPDAAGKIVGAMLEHHLQG